MERPEPAIRQKLTVRAKDPAGRPQMAEGSIPGRGGVTGSDDFFIVHHYAPPVVDESDWTIEIVDSGDRRLAVSRRDLAALPERSVTALLECAGMSRGHLPEPKPGTQFGHGLVGTAVWTGVRLADVLDLAKVGRDFGTLVIHAADSGTTQPEDVHSDFSRGLPRDKAVAEDTLLAWAMNGQPLPFLHGGPVRLVVPGWFGVNWVKWPRSLQATKGTGYDGFWQSRRYTYQSDDLSHRGVVQSLLPRSLITSPGAGTRVPRGPVQLKGIAWAGDEALSLVEVTADGGRSWAAAKITARYGRWAWVRWEAAIEVAGPTGLRPVAVRATDASGRRQDWHSVDNRLGYGNNAIHSIKLDVVA